MKHNNYYMFSYGYCCSLILAKGKECLKPSFLGQICHLLLMNTQWITKFDLLFFCICLYKCRYLNPPPDSKFIDKLIGHQAQQHISILKETKFTVSYFYQCCFSKCFSFQLRKIFSQGLGVTTAFCSDNRKITSVDT